MKPLSFFKKQGGDLVEKKVESPADEAQAREQGFLPLEELYPDPAAKKGPKK